MGLGAGWRGGREGPDLAATFQEKSSAQLPAGRCRYGVRRGACRAMSGLAGTQLVWVVEWQAGKPSESTAGCGQAEKKPPFGTCEIGWLENVARTLLGQYGACIWGWARGSGLSLMNL